MRLDGIHHTYRASPGMPPINLAFYTGVLGLAPRRRKTVNQDDPYVYHLFYSDEDGSPGADLTFFEYPGALPGRAGAGMIYRISLRVPSVAAIDFWEKRLGGRVKVIREDDRLRFIDPEGLGLELVPYAGSDRALPAHHPEIPAEMALSGFDNVRAYGARVASTRRILEEVMGGERSGEYSWEFAGSERHGTIALRRAAGAARPPRRRHSASRRLCDRARRARAMARAAA